MPREIIRYKNIFPKRSKLLLRPFFKATEMMINEELDYIENITLNFISFFEYYLNSTLKQSSKSPSGGNQVDDLPPAFSV